jgi:hypothetical protein
VSYVALALSFVLAGPALVAAFNLPPGGAAFAVASRFYLLPMLLVCVAGALAIDAIAPPIAARPLHAGAVAVVLAAAQAGIAVPEVREHTRPTVALYAENTLRAAPPNAIIVGSGDHRWGGFLYARYATHTRTDVVFVVQGLVAQAWYRRMLHAMTGVDFDTPEGKPIGPKTTMSRLLATGRPLFYTDWPDPKVTNAPHYTVGTLMRIVRPAERAPTPDVLFAINDGTFALYQTEPTVPQDEHSWSFDLQADYARAWGELGERYQAESRPADAQTCFARAGWWAPWLVSVRGEPEDD